MQARREVSPVQRSGLPGRAVRDAASPQPPPRWPRRRCSPPPDLRRINIQKLCHPNLSASCTSRRILVEDRVPGTPSGTAPASRRDAGHHQPPGRQRGTGKGRVVRWQVEPVDEPWPGFPLVMDGHRCARCLSTGLASLWPPSASTRCRTCTGTRRAGCRASSIGRRREPLGQHRQRHATAPDLRASTNYPPRYLAKHVETARNILRRGAPTKGPLSVSLSGQGQPRACAPGARNHSGTCRCFTWPAPTACQLRQVQGVLHRPRPPSTARVPHARRELPGARIGLPAERRRTVHQVVSEIKHATAGGLWAGRIASGAGARHAHRGEGTRAPGCCASAVSLPDARRLVECCPLAYWSTADVWAYIVSPRHPVPAAAYDAGPTDRRARPCTQRPAGSHR